MPLTWSECAYKRQVQKLAGELNLPQVFRHTDALVGKQMPAIQLSRFQEETLVET